MTIAKRLLLLIGVQLVLLAGLTLFSWRQFDVIEDQSSFLIRNVTPSMAILGHLGHDLAALRRLTVDCAEASAMDRPAAQARLAEQFAKIDNAIAHYRAKLIAGYKEKMDGFNAGVFKLEEAFKTGNNAVAVQIIQELGAMQKEGHKEYKSKSID